MPTIEKTYIGEGCRGSACTLAHCADCDQCAQVGPGLLMVCADLGDGAFLSVLCDSCWHRRQYRAELERRRRARRSA